MNTDRRTLGWLSILCTVVFCLPGECVGVFLVATSISNTSDSTDHWTGTDTAIAAVSGGAALLVILIGVFLVRGGMKTLQRDSSSSGLTT